MDDINWGRLLDPTHSLLNAVARGTIVYLALFAVLRVTHNRQSGNIGLSDLLLITLTTGAVQNSMVGDGKSLTEGGVVAGTIFFWSYALNWLAFRFPRLRWLAKSRPRAVIEDGNILHLGLRRELLTKDDLMAQLREQGVEDVSAVQKAYIEANGALSVIMREKNA